MSKIKILLALSISLLALTGCTSDEKKAAIAKYDLKVQEIEDYNAKVEDLTSKITLLLDENKPVLDSTVAESLKLTLEKKDSHIISISKRPSEVEKILEVVGEYEQIDLNSYLDEISTLEQAYQNSIKKYELVNNPDEVYVLEKLKAIDGILEVVAATEENDPNGKLGKPGGYTSQMYFSYNIINQSEVYGENLIEKGTRAGGSVEVYMTSEDAKKRDDYLAAFDGTFIASSHKVVGTVIVRTSDELTASQQKTLEEIIIMKLTELKYI